MPWRTALQDRLAKELSAVVNATTIRSSGGASGVGTVDRDGNSDAVDEDATRPVLSIARLLKVDTDGAVDVLTPLEALAQKLNVQVYVTIAVYAYFRMFCVLCLCSSI
jgi:hypothetical protein